MEPHHFSVRREFQGKHQVLEPEGQTSGKHRITLPQALDESGGVEPEYLPHWELFLQDTVSQHMGRDEERSLR
jgi:hypothetical protein